MEATQARLSLHLSKCHIVGNHSGPSFNSAMVIRSGCQNNIKIEILS